jgi:hypothetical protein
LAEKLPRHTILLCDGARAAPLDAQLKEVGHARRLFGFPRFSYFDSLDRAK